MTDRPQSPTRRGFLGAATTGALAIAATPVATRASAQDTKAAGVAAGEDFPYEVTRSDAEWRERLGEEEYAILRGGDTEFPFTSEYWNVNNPGTYHCKGCDLPIYTSDFYSEQPIGFAFFRQSIPNSVLTGVDITDYNGAFPKPVELMEVHCRRCGSHLGHIVAIKKKPLHCINGKAIRLKPSNV